MAQTRDVGFTDMNPEEKAKFESEMSIVNENMRPVLRTKNELMHEGYKQAKSIFLSF